MDNNLGLKDLFKIFLECPEEYVSIVFNVSSNITGYFTLTNFLVLITWFIFLRLNRNQSIVDELKNPKVKNKYSLFILYLTTTYLVLLIISIFYGLFFMDKSCWYKYY